MNTPAYNFNVKSDLSYPIMSEMPTFPGDGKVSLFHQQSYERDGYRLSRLDAPLHAGTHIDMPSHLTSDRRMALDYSPDNFIAPGVILDCAGQRSIAYLNEYAKLVQPGDALLIHTGYADLYAEPGRYYTDFPALTEGFTKFVCESGITILGLDTPSPDREPYSLHKILLERGIYIVENLTNLNMLFGRRPHSFIFSALPLKIDAEASPVRALALEII